MLTKSRICVDQEMCHVLANRLSTMDIPEPKENVPELPFSDAEEANFWFFLAAICHQTSPVGQPVLEGNVEGGLRRGWDYLVHAFRLASTQNRELLTPQVWAEFDSCKITSLFSPFISQPQRRAELVMDLGRGLDDRGWDSILSASLFCDHYISNHQPNLLDLLAEFEAYSDPVQKKSVFFLALMQNGGLWQYIDAESLPAPVDYHEVRGHLRIGTVRLADPELLRRITSHEPISCEEDIALRMVVRDAIQLVSELVKRSPNSLHYLFWNLFRTYCVRQRPHCDGKTFDRLPIDYAHAVQIAGGHACPFREFCMSADSEQAIDEHCVVTEYY